VPRHIICKFPQSNFIEGTAWVGLGYVQQREREVAVLGGIEDLGFHDGVLLSMG
jgi:hypothetical protein